MSQYIPTTHAIDRLQHRLGVKPTQAKRWVNEALCKATYLITQKVRGQAQAIYEHKGVRLVVDELTKTVITVKPTVDTSILKPVFEREFRRLKREVTRNTRKLELIIAELTVQMGERMTAKARAKNPQTRGIIDVEVQQIAGLINDKQAEIKRELDKLENFRKATEVYL